MKEVVRSEAALRAVQSERQGRHQRWRRRLAHLPYWLLLFVVVTWSLAPIVFVLSSSLKLPRDIFSYPPRLLPETATLRNFVFLFREWPAFPRALGNSLIIALGTIVVVVTVGLLAAYAFSRYRSRLLRGSAVFIIAVRMFPPIIISIPLFPILNRLNLSDHHLTLVLLYATFEVTMVTWIMKAFIDGIPREVQEAALVDGATGMQVFWRIILPLSRPVLVAGAILAGTYAWNEFTFGFLFTASRARTTPVLIAEMIGGLEGAQWGAVFAASTIQFLPALVFLWIIQGHLIRGMTSGAVKG